MSLQENNPVDQFVSENADVPMSKMIEIGLARGYSRLELNTAMRNYLFGPIDLTADFIPGEPK